MSSISGSVPVRELLLEVAQIHATHHLNSVIIELIIIELIELIIIIIELIIIIIELIIIELIIIIIIIELIGLIELITDPQRECARRAEREVGGYHRHHHHHHHGESVFDAQAAPARGDILVASECSPSVGAGAVRVLRRAVVVVVENR